MLGAIRPGAGGGGGGGGGAVASVFGRSGAVTANTNDYSAAQIAGLGGGVGAVVITPASTQALTASSTIAASAGTVPISAASAITLASNPQIATGVDGQRITVINVGSNAITFVSGNGLLLPQNIILYGGRLLSFTYSAAFSSWIYDGLIPESVALTGIPTAPTAAWNANSTQLATTAQVFNHLYNHDSPGWRALTLTANWANLGGSYPAPSIKRIGRDLIQIRGVVSVTGSYAGAITTIPVDCRPANQLLFSSAASPGSGQFIITSAGALTSITALAVGQYQSICISYSL